MNLRFSRLFLECPFALLLALGGSLATTRPLLAQSTELNTELNAEAASALKVSPRFHLQHGSSTAGFDGITSLGGFIPLTQRPGLNITFIEGDLLLDNGANLGWSVNLGFRKLNDDRDRLRGGYLGFDGRTTDNSTFYQLAAGYESLGKDWDVRLNGYVPISSRLNQIQNLDIDTGLQTNRGFEADKLVLSAVRERQRLVQEEEALGGFDAEVGRVLTRWDGGELTGAVGGYLLTGEESSLGGQLRLNANFLSNFHAGLAFQHDGLFGSSLAFSVGASFPQVRFQDPEEQDFQETHEVAIRLRDPIQRRPTVAIQERTEAERIFEETIEPLRNPEEEQDYRFIHVTLGLESSGDGSFEAPFGSVEEAIALVNSDADTFSDGNTIIYVDGETAPGRPIPGFTIPERVRVLSQGPQQTIGGMPFPGFSSTLARLPFSSENNFNRAESDAPNANGVTVLLPESGDGVFPVISGGETADLVTLGNRTVLAGFQLQNAAQHGVAGSNVSNVELRNNSIIGSGGSGIFLDDVGGSVTLFDNLIADSGDRGILARNTQTLQSVDIAIAGYELRNNQVGMEFTAIAQAVGPNGEAAQAPAQIIAISPSSTGNTSVGNPTGVALNNSVTNSRDEGIIVNASGNALLSSASQEFTLNQGMIQGSGSFGIQLSANVGASVQEFNVFDSVITGNGATGIDILNGPAIQGPNQTASSQEIVIRNSEISNNQGSGINIALGDASTQELVIRGNQITGNTGDGIRSLAQNVSIQEWRNDVATGDVGASENTMTGNGGQGIRIDAQDLATLPVVGVADNTVNSNAAGPGIEIASDSQPRNVGSPTTCLVLRGNRVDSGIQLTGRAVAATSNLPSFQVQDLANVLSLNGPTPITFSSQFGGAVTTPDASPFENEVGSCID